MLKTVLYYLLLLTTSVRFVDIIYLMAKKSTNLPAVVLIVTTAMIVYAITLLFKKHTNAVRLKQLSMFFMVQSVMIVFNIIYMTIACPLQVTAAETLIVGTFLDLLVNCGILYLCSRQMRGSFATASR